MLESNKRQIVYTEESDGLKISIRARRQDFLAYTFLAVWFCGWTIAGVKGIGNILDDPPSRLPLWPLGWAFAEIAAAVTILFLLGGREVIMITPDFVRRKRQIFGIGWTQEYFLHEVLNLRHRPPIGRRSGWLAFDYEGVTLKLVSDVNSEEAVELLSRIRHYMREYGAMQPPEQHV